MSLLLLTPLYLFSHLYSKYKRIKKSSLLSYSLLVLIPAFFITLWVVFSPQSHPNQLDFNPYELLGVPENATSREIKRRYRRLTLDLHPDRISKENSPQQHEEAVRHFQKIIRSQEILTNEEMRRNYDESGHPEGRAWWDDEYPDWVVRPNASALLITYGTIGALLLFIPLAVKFLIPALKEPPLFVRNHYFDQMEHIEETYLVAEKDQEAFKAFEKLNSEWEETQVKFPRWSRSDWYTVVEFALKSRLALCHIIFGNAKEANNLLTDFKKNHRDSYKKREVQAQLAPYCDDMRSELKKLEKGTKKGTEGAGKVKSLGKTISSIA